MKYLSGPLYDLPQSLVLCWGYICIGSYVQIFDGGAAEVEVELLLLRQEVLNIFQWGTGTRSYHWWLLKGRWNVGRGAQKHAGGNRWLMLFWGRRQKTSLSRAKIILGMVARRLIKENLRISSSLRLLFCVSDPVKNFLAEHAAFLSNQIIARLYS